MYSQGGIDLNYMTDYKDPRTELRKGKESESGGDTGRRSAEKADLISRLSAATAFAIARRSIK